MTSKWVIRGTHPYRDGGHILPMGQRGIDIMDALRTGHVHEWERGSHMAAAFGVDGRKLHCAICGIPKQERAS